MSDDPGSMMREAIALARQQRAPEAMSAYRAIVARWPQFADAWYNLGVLQRQNFQMHEALDSYAKALLAGIERPEEVLLNRSVIFTEFLQDHAAAMHDLQQALTLNPGYAPALLNLATLYEDFGKREQASALYARIIDSDADSNEALARFANLQPVDAIDAALITRVQSAMANAIDPRARASLGFALGRLLDATAQYPQAFLAYTAANEASRASTLGHVVPYDRARQEGYIDQMIRSGRPAARAHANGSPQPIFICGMFRSGSTLTEQLLTAIPGLSAGGENNFIPQFISTDLQPFFETLAGLSGERLDKIAAHYRAELSRVHPGASWVTDKRPDNFLYLGLIKSLFPAAKIINTTRDPLDNCLSIYFLHLEQQMSYALDLMDIAHYYRQYRRLIAHWKSQFPEDIYDLHYDTLVHDPQTSMRELCGFLGFEWSGVLPEVSLRSGAIKTASSWQVREPLYTRSSGRSRHYADELAGLRSYLADLQ